MFALLVACMTLARAELPLITDARVPATPPGATVAAGYLTLTNSADEPLILRGASSTSVPTVELHRTQISNDVASMKKQRDVTIPPGKTLAFDHGGYHLMLMGLEKPLSVGEVIDLTLDTSAGEVDLSMPVIEPGTDYSDRQGEPDDAMGNPSRHEDDRNEEPMQGGDMSDESMNGDGMSEERDQNGMDHESMDH